ncbi:hypothetical protein [Clostridium sp. UBA1056]
MSDIHECNGCSEQVYMDNAEQCIVWKTSISSLYKPNNKWN